MAITQMYDTYFARIQQLRPSERVTRARNMAWLLTGLFVGQCVHLNYIARKIPGKSQELSKVKRLTRLLDNGHIRVLEWYEPVARDLLTTAVNHGLVPVDARVQVAGDSEFGAIDVLRRLDQWGWGYALRQKGSHLLRPTGQSPWKRCDSLVTQPGQSCWIDSVLLTQKHAYPTRFLALWQKGESEPWLLATNLASAQDTRQLYSVRMWIEEMFADSKGHGFDLEASRLDCFLRLSRLTLAVPLL